MSLRSTLLIILWNLFKGGQSRKFTYKYVGKKILTYKKGNRGVRFLFEATDADAGQFKYVQF